MFIYLYSGILPSKSNILEKWYRQETLLFQKVALLSQKKIGRITKGQLCLNLTTSGIDQGLQADIFLHDPLKKLLDFRKDFTIWWDNKIHEFLIKMFLTN